MSKYTELALETLRLISNGLWINNVHISHYRVGIGFPYNEVLGFVFFPKYNSSVISYAATRRGFEYWLNFDKVFGIGSLESP